MHTQMVCAPLAVERNNNIQVHRQDNKNTHTNAHNITCKRCVNRMTNEIMKHMKPVVAQSSGKNCKRGFCPNPSVHTTLPVVGGTKQSRYCFPAPRIACKMLLGKP